MKKIILILFTLIILLSRHNASADVIMEGYKPVQFCAKIINLDQYPTIEVLADQYGATANHDIFVVENNKCIQTYKFNDIDLYWNTIGEGMTVDPSKKLVEKFQHYHAQVKDTNPLESITREYVLSQNSDGTFSLVLAREKIVPEVPKSSNESTVKKTPKTPKTSKKTTKKVVKKESHSVTQEKNQIQEDKSLVQEKSHKDNEQGFVVHKTFWQKIISFFAHIFS